MTKNSMNRPSQRPTKLLSCGRPKIAHQVRAPRSVLAGRRSHASDRDRTSLGISARLAHESDALLSLNGAPTTLAPVALSRRVKAIIRCALRRRQPVAHWRVTSFQNSGGRDPAMS